MPVTYDSLVKSLQKKDYQPIYFLCGDEPYFIDQISNYIANNILDESEKGFNQTVVYGKEADIDAIVNMASRYPMMSQYQVIIVKEAQDIKKIDELTNYLKSPIKSTILTICYKHKKVDKRTKFYKTLESSSVFFESKKLYSNKVPAWINNRLAEKGFKIKDTAAFLLTEYLGEDLTKIDNALQKLIINLPEGEAITTTIIEKNIGISREYNVFELQKAIAKRNQQKALQIVSYMQNNSKQNPFPQIIGALFNYFSKVIVLQYSKEPQRQIAQKINVPEYFIGEYIEAGQNYKGKLQQIISWLHEYDLRSKGVNDSGTEEGELLREMVLKIMN